MSIAAALAFGCDQKPKSAPAEVVGASGGTPAATTVATQTAAPPQPFPNSNMPQAPANGDPFAQARNAQPAGGAGAMSDPFAAARLVPVHQLPDQLPADPGGGMPLKIAAMTLTFAGPMASVNSTAELKQGGGLLLDSKRGGSVGGNKVVITAGKHPISFSIRSDGYATFKGVTALKSTFFHKDADGLTSRDANRLSVSADGLAIVSVGAGGEQLIARVSPAVTDERTKTTALMIAEAEAGHIVDVHSGGK